MSYITKCAQTHIYIHVTDLSVEEVCYIFPPRKLWFFHDFWKRGGAISYMCSMLYNESEMRSTYACIGVSDPRDCRTHRTCDENKANAANTVSHKSEFFLYLWSLCNYTGGVKKPNIFLCYCSPGSRRGLMNFAPFTRMQMQPLSLLNYYYSLQANPRWLCSTAGGGTINFCRRFN